MGIPKFITDRYTDGGAGLGSLDFSNIAKDLGAATALYGVINPNDSSGLADFFGTGKQQQPVGYMGGIPNYTATRELAPNAFAPTYATPTGEVAARRPGMAGRRYFTDTTFEQSTDEPFMGVTAEQIAAQNQAAIDEQALFESILGNVENQRIAGAATTGTTGAATTGTTAATTNTTGTTFPEGTDGNGVVSNSVLDGFGEVVGDTTDTGGTTGGTVYDESGVYTAGGYKVIPYNNFVNQFMGRDLTADDAAALASSGYSLDALAKSFGVSAADLQNFVNYYTTGTGGTTTSTGQLTSAQLKQAVLDGTMDYNAAYKALGVADAVNPFGFTDTEQMALGIHESQRTGQGYKYNSTTGSTDLYDYDAGEWVDDTVVDDTVVDDTVVDETDAAFNTFISPFYNQEQLTPAQLIQLGDSGYDLSTIASTLDVDLTTLTNAITQATSAAANAAANVAELDTFGTVAGIRSREEIEGLIAGIKDKKWTAGDVAEQFNVAELDVLEELLRSGFYGFEDNAIADAAAGVSMEEEELVVQLLRAGKTNFAEVAEYYQDQYPGITAAQVAANYNNTKFAQGGNVNGYYLGGTTDGMADQVPATIDNMQPAALSDGEFVIPADVVGHLGNGNSDAGAQNLYSMMERVRKDRTGNPEQGRQIDPNQYLA